MNTQHSSSSENQQHIDYKTILSNMTDNNLEQVLSVQYQHPSLYIAATQEKNSRQPIIHSTRQRNRKHAFIWAAAIIALISTLSAFI